MNEEQKNMDTCLAENILSEVALVLTILCCVFFGGCKTVEPCIPETITRDIVSVEYKLDSVYLYERDSIFVHEKRDTVFVERWRTRYKDVLKIKRDTVIDKKTEVQVQITEITPRYYRFCSWAFWIVVAIMLIRLAWWIAKKYYWR